MRKTVKITSIIASVSILISLTACGDDSKTESKQSSLNSGTIQSTSTSSSKSKQKSESQSNVGEFKPERSNPDNEDFSKEIAPFFWAEFEDEFSVCLVVGEYLQGEFDSQSDKGFEGNGYDWENLAIAFIEEEMPDLTDKVEFDSEAGMFCALSKDSDALQRFVREFKKACEDKVMITGLFGKLKV